MSSRAVDATRTWLSHFVIAHDICPFAGREFRRDSIRYAVIEADTVEARLQALADECRRLDETTDIATTLLIFPATLTDFDDYLDELALAEALLASLEYDGIYQLASFHPDYVFADVEADDPANETNRSPYPMWHLLREEAVTRVLQHHPDPQAIPERNVACLREAGSTALAAARACRARRSES